MQFSLAQRAPLRSQRELLGKYFAPQRGRIAWLAALILADIGLRLLNPQIVRIFIDTAEAGGPLAKLTTAAVLFLVVGLLGRGLDLGSTYAGLNLSWASTNRLRADLAAHLLRLDMPFHKTHTPGELIERVDGDVTTLAQFFADMIVKVLGNALLVIAILFLLYREDARAGGILTAYTLVVLVALALVGRIGVRAWTDAREAWAAQMGFLEERFAGTEDIRGIGAERHAESRLATLALDLLYKARRGWLANALGFAVTNFLFVVGYGLGLAIGAGLYMRGEVTIGTAFLIVAYIGMLAAPLEEIRGQAEQLQEATAGANRVSEVLALEPEVRDRGAAALQPGALSVDFDHLSFRYRDTAEAPENQNGEPVLHYVTFSLPAGRVLGVLGRTGSGKTTLTRLLFRLYDPEAGSIRLGGDRHPPGLFCVAPGGRRAGDPGRSAVRGHGAREHHPLRRRGRRRGDRGRARRTRHPGLGPRHAAGVSHEAGAGRRRHVGRRSAAAGLRPHPPARSGPGRARRSRLPAGPGDRAPAGAGHRLPAEGQRPPEDRDRHRAPAAHGRPGRRHPDPRTGPRGRVWPACRAGRRSRFALQPAPPHGHGGGAGMSESTSSRLGKQTMAVLPFNRALIGYASRPFSVHAVLQIFFLWSRVLPGLVEKAVFDTITGQAAVTFNLWALIAAYVGIGLARMIATYGETFAGWSFRYTAGALVRRNLFAGLLRRPGALQHPIAPGEAVYRYRTDVAEVCDFPTWFPDVAGNLLSFVTAVAIMAAINWQITLVAFLPILVAFGVGRAAWSRMLLYRKLEGEAGDRVTGFLSEMFGAVQALKVAGAKAEANAVRHYDRLNEERRRTAMQAKMLDTFAFSIHSFAVVLSTGAMLLMASRGMVEGTFTVGDFALFTYFLWFTSEFPSYLGTFVGDFKQQEVAIERLSELLPEEPTAAIVAPRPAFPYREGAGWLLAPALEAREGDRAEQRGPRRGPA